MCSFHLLGVRVKIKRLAPRTNNLVGKTSQVVDLDFTDPMVNNGVVKYFKIPPD